MQVSLNIKHLFNRFQILSQFEKIHILYLNFVSDENSTSMSSFRSSYRERNSRVFLFFRCHRACWDLPVRNFCFEFFLISSSFSLYCIRCSDFDCCWSCSDSKRNKTAYVTFKYPKALEIALLLSVYPLFYSYYSLLGFDISVFVSFYEIYWNLECKNWDFCSGETYMLLPISKLI